MALGVVGVLVQCQEGVAGQAQITGLALMLTLTMMMTTPGQPGGPEVQPEVLHEAEQVAGQLCMLLLPSEMQACLSSQLCLAVPMLSKCMLFSGTCK